MATGSKSHPYLKETALCYRCVSIGFGGDLLQSINRMADKADISFSEAVRRICRDHFEKEGA